MSRSSPVLAAAFLTMACVEGPSLGSSGEPPVIRVTPARPGGVARVAHLEVSMAANAGLDPGDLWLFEGGLTNYHLARINRRELPATLSERRLSVRVGLSGSHIAVVPNVALQPGERYTLAAPGWGELAHFDVDPDDPTPLLARVWPPEGTAVDRSIVLCADQAPVEPFDVPLDFTALVARAEPHFGAIEDGRTCVSVSVPLAARGLGPLGFTAEAGDALLDPVPFECESSTAPVPAVCVEGELPLGPGCASVDDDRVRVRGPDEPTLWQLDGEYETRVESVAAGGQWVIRGLIPDTEQRVSGRALSVGGVEMPFDLRVRTLPARSHLVINEVLANPIGSEPAGEWVELVNDGQVPAELAGLWLRDSAGAVELPAATLLPGEYVLLVRSDFPVLSAGDVPPAPGTQLVSLTILAKGGLSNSGEPLQLEDANGSVLSRFPALPARHAGVSLARARTDSLDDDARAFAEHGPPGASPGAENH